MISVSDISLFSRSNIFNKEVNLENPRAVLPIARKGLLKRIDRAHP